MLFSINLVYKLVLIIILITLTLNCLQNILIECHKHNVLQRNLSQTNISFNPVKYLHENMRCYVDRDFVYESDLLKIDDILLNNRKPRKGKSIFFHETSCSKTGELKLNARQACAIESAALLNPNYDIFVLFASPIVRSNQNQSENEFNILEVFNFYKNIYLRNVNLWRYADDTPISKWIDYGQLFYSYYIETQLSDVLRFLTLWRWGGTHLDLDIILKKTLENITPNFVGIESKWYIGSAVINLDFEGLGHKIAILCLEYCTKYFVPIERNCIGPPVITKVLAKICKTNFTILMRSDWCSGFKVFQRKAFYPILWDALEYYFDPNFLNETLILTNKSIAIHIWNRFSKHYFVKVGSKVAYDVYAKKYCPKVYSLCGEYF